MVGRVLHRIRRSRFDWQRSVRWYSRSFAASAGPCEPPCPRRRGLGGREHPARPGQPDQPGHRRLAAARAAAHRRADLPGPGPPPLTGRGPRCSPPPTIAGIAAWVSYWHMAGVAARYGETGASPYLLPLSVDGLIVVRQHLPGRARRPHLPAWKPKQPRPRRQPVTAAESAAQVAAHGTTFDPRPGRPRTRRHA